MHAAQSVHAAQSAHDHGPPPPAPTPEQQALLARVRDEWTGHGLAVGPADRAEAEAGVREVYLGAGRRPPERVIWLGSPMAGAIGADIRAGRLPLVTRRAWRTLPETAGEDIVDRVPQDPPETDLIMVDPAPPGLDRLERDRRWGGLLARLDREVSAAVDAGLGRAVGTAVDQAAPTWQDEQVLPEVGALPRLGEYRPRTPGRLARLDFLHRCGVLELDRHTRGVLRVERAAGEWWPMRDTAILTERPVELHRDEQGRLHHPDGPAVRYPDGWCLWAWHGVLMPREIVEADELPIRRAVGLRNTEQRRCAVEMLAGRAGWRELVGRAGLPRIGREVPDPGNPGQTLSLWCVAELYGEHLHLLLMTNGTVERDGTRREFGELVPGTIRDPVQAAAWQIGLTRSQYLETVRRT